VFISGGVLGRIIGSLVCPLGFTTYQPWEFAIIGAAAFSTGVTRAISTALIVYEISGTPNLRIPLSVAILSAYFVGNRFTKNIYDIIIDTIGSPYLQDLPRAAYAVPASQVMMATQSEEVLSLQSTYRDAKALLDANDEIEVIPVVSSLSSMVLVGAVLRENLRRTVRHFHSSVQRYRDRLYFLQERSRYYFFQI